MKVTKELLKFSLQAFIFLALFARCHPNGGEVQPDPAFSKYITSFTSGAISSESPVMVRLRNLPPGLQPGQVLSSSVFGLAPSVKGETVVDQDGTLTFRPEVPFESDTRYTVTLSLGKLVEVDKPFRVFRFGFNTMKQDFSVEEEGLHADNALQPGIMSFTGTLVTADFADPAAVEKLVRASYDSDPHKLTWTHSTDRRSHIFTVDSLVRDEYSGRKLLIEWDGTPLKIRNKGKLVVEVPGENEFKILGVKTQTAPEPRVIVRFSDPLAVDQQPEGLVEFENGVRFTWQVDGNLLTLWPAEMITGETSVTIYRGLRNSDGRSLQETGKFPLFFKNLKPQLRLLGKGVIVPDQGSLSLPFEAVSLKAVNLRIIKIFASNIRQFLQENQVDGEEDIKKVGRLVYSGKVELNPDMPEKRFNWNTYRIDLDRFLKPEQGAIYRVELRFRKAYSLCECQGEIAPEEDSVESSEKEDWDAPGWYSLYYWPEDYDWQQRDNPCDNSYYSSARFVSRNIYSSNLGILAKEGKGFRYTFAVTNLNTAGPEEGTEISLFDYQHQFLGKCTTDEKGFASYTPEHKPFMAMAVKGNQTGYLRIDDGSSLSLSNFDVSGEEVQEGVKGFIYGERGVWRPGDRLFLTFILDDPEKRIPAHTPVIFRMVNSRGQEVFKRVATASENGFYHFPVETRPDDPTGNWYAKVQVGGASFEKRIKVETVKPNRLKIDLQLPDPVRAGVRQQASLSATWLHGAVANSLKAVVETEMFPVKTTFKGYEKYSFDNPGAVYSPSKQTVFDGRLDGKGQVIFPLEFPFSKGFPGKLRAWFTTRVFEDGGDFSINARQAEFSPYKRYLGIRMPEEEDGWYATGKVYQPEVVALSPEGTPMPLGKAEISLYKIDWRWWWEAGEDHLAHYVSGNNYQPLKTWSVTSASPLEKFNLSVEYHTWRDNGRYLLYVRDLENGHAAGVTFYMSEWGGWRTDATPEGATMLALTTDKEKYVTGEKIRVRIPSPANARALVSLEDGRQVKDIFWVKTTDNETFFNVEVKPGMAPTLYIHVTLIQPYGSTRNDAPIRLYGVCPVAVEDPGTVLHPEIRMNDELEPEKEFFVKIREKNGKEMTYTLAIVDEGLLDLTGFQTPDPHGSFYAREALGVKTYDLFDYVAGAYGARLEKAFAVGGDEDKRMAGRSQVSRFQPVVLFAGPFTLPRGGSGSHSFKMPSYVGSVKAMVVAGNCGSYGNSSKTAKVRNAVMILATLPRVAGPGEEISLPVEIFALKESTRQVTVSLSVSGMMTPLGETSKIVTFSQPGSKIVWFTVKTAGRTGIAPVKVMAVSGKETAHYETELEIRNPNPAVLAEKSGLVEAGKTWHEALTAPGMEGSNTAFLELSAVPGLNLSRHLGDLIRYPHGCAEQTVSTGLSQLYLENLVKLSAAEKQETAANINRVIQRLQGMQTGSGGFAYWPGQNEADDWCSSYAGHFLILASQKGYMFPPVMRSSWLKYQVSRARVWKPAPGAGLSLRKQEALIQAYRLYTLALAGSPEPGIMNRFREEVAGYPQARWRLAAAYLLSGQSAAADRLLEQLNWQTEPYPEHGSTYGSELRDKAMILETLLLKNNREKAFRLLVEMAGEIGSSEWLSTQTSAWCFYSISRYFGTFINQNGMDVKVTSGGKPVILHSGQAVIKLPLEIEATGKTDVMVENTGSFPVYARMFCRGIPLVDVSGEDQRNLFISAHFTGRDGKPVDPSNLPQGSDLFLNLSVSHPGIRGTYKDMALTTIFPSGWEILNSRLSDIPENLNRRFDYQDIRDDRVYTYFSLKTGETIPVRIALHAAYEGRYFLPAVVAEGMYDNSVYARIPGQWVKVIRK